MSELPERVVEAAGHAWGRRTYENELLPRDLRDSAEDPLVDALQGAMDPVLGPDRLVVAGPYEQEIARLRDLVGTALSACMPLLPLVGSWPHYRLSEHVDNQVIATHSEWVDAALAIAALGSVVEPGE